MSYSIVFKVKVADTNEYLSVGSYVASVTWNVREIIVRSTGLPWENGANNGYCKDVIPFIKKGRDELVAHPGRYKCLEPDNGWGTVGGVVKFFTRIIEAWEDFALWTKPEIVDKTTFWIE